MPVSHAWVCVLPWCPCRAQQAAGNADDARNNLSSETHALAQRKVCVGGEGAARTHGACSSSAAPQTMCVCRTPHAACRGLQEEQMSKLAQALSIDSRKNKEGDAFNRELQVGLRKRTAPWGAQR